MENSVKYVFLEHEKIVGRKYTVRRGDRKKYYRMRSFINIQERCNISGGDPVAHIEFACELLLRLKTARDPYRHRNLWCVL